MSLTKFRVGNEWVPLPSASTVLSESAYSWASWDGASMSVHDSYNVDQLVDEGLGYYSMKFPEVVSSNMAIMAGCDQKATTTNTNANTVPFVPAETVSNNSVSVQCFFPGNSSYKGDPGKVSLVVFI
ncbi:MAG: hypothetical protein ISR34_08210 [Pirellulales bacterium]|nr:hypothetical protein [Pirellulales bacterium]